MEKVRVAVIGLGMGRNHVKGFVAHPAADVVAIADTDEKRLKEIGDLYNIPGRYTDAAKMLRSKKLDAVSIATPNKFHKPLALAAFKAGCHVLCEKPMAMNAREAERMLVASRRAGKLLMINFSYRFREQSMALKKEVETGALGDVYFARTVWHRRRGIPGFGGWFCSRALAGGGPLIDLGVHRLDLALWLMNYPKPVWVMGSMYCNIASVLARREGKVFDVEDLAVGLIKFENGATLEIEASWAANIAEKELMETRLLGTRGGLIQHNIHEGYEFEAELYLESEGVLSNRKIVAMEKPVHTSYYCFIESILGNAAPVATGEEGLIVMELLDALYKSATTGKPVQIRRALTKLSAGKG